MNSVIEKAKADMDVRWEAEMKSAVEDYEAEKDDCSDYVEQEQALAWYEAILRDTE